ncbi:zinc finger BED domain-containing protein 5-like [Eucyclogobius newberryi]|uniref:zinc finger BED domain-containing protein 5-like n=1 Tax=Eucyclogobius newberryi TaxID=166745 RepID=UPI003B5C4D2A
MKQVSLSNDTVKSRIFDMSCNIKSQLLAKVKASPVFAIQLDESVDGANLYQLIVFVQYVHGQSIEEDLLLCRPLETTTQAADVMQLVDAFFEEEGLDWGRLVHACTDGAPAMLGARSGFVKQKNPKVVTLHCIIHREALASRTMTQPLKEALETAIRLVNFVNVSTLNTRLFRRLCQDMESDYEGLLFHTAVRWLSKGDMLNRLVHLLPEVTPFLEERNKRDLKVAVSDEAFQCSKTAGGVSDVLKNEVIIHLNRLLDEVQHYFPDFKCLINLSV